MKSQTLNCPLMILCLDLNFARHQLLATFDCHPLFSHEHCFGIRILSLLEPLIYPRLKTFSFRSRSLAFCECYRQIQYHPLGIEIHYLQTSLRIGLKLWIHRCRPRYFQNRLELEVQVFGIIRFATFLLFEILCRLSCFAAVESLFEVLGAFAWTIFCCIQYI